MQLTNLYKRCTINTTSKHLTVGKVAIVFGLHFSGQELFWNFHSLQRVFRCLTAEDEIPETKILWLCTLPETVKYSQIMTYQHLKMWKRPLVCKQTRQNPTKRSEKNNTQHLDQTQCFKRLECQVPWASKPVREQPKWQPFFKSACARKKTNHN